MGGISGILFAVLAVPSFLPPPDTPVVTSASQDVIDYFNERQDGILTNNGLLLVFAAFFSLWFLGVLYGLLRAPRAKGMPCSRTSRWRGEAVRSIDAGGSSGRDRLPAILARFENFQQDAQLGVLSLALSGRMYRFAFVGMSALIAAASLVALGTGVLPRWLAWAGFLFALAALLRLVGPLARG
ncbi:MAG TPA: hypothetical protein VEY13_14545 [Rubrobacteraceae bacterium]|nr:hypothetical protein [Rubrobacteraceae bacterium]